MQSRGSFSCLKSAGPYACLWEDRESGQKRFKTLVHAEDVLFLSTRERGQDEAEAVEDLPFSSDWRLLISHGRRSDP